MGNKLKPEDCFHPETNEEGSVVGFYWVEGTADAPWYCVILLGRNKRGGTHMIEFKGTSTVSLIDTALKAGWELGDPATVSRLCESAGSSRHIVRDKRFKSEAKIYKSFQELAPLVQSGAPDVL